MKLILSRLSSLLSTILENKAKNYFFVFLHFGANATDYYKPLKMNENL